MKQLIPNKVIVIGNSHHNSLGIIRSLGEFGCRVFHIVLSNKEGFTTKSRYIKKFWCSNDEKKVIEILINEFGDDKEKPIIIAAGDRSASIIDRNINLLSNYFIFSSVKNTECGIINMMEKSKMNMLAEEHGFLVPKSFNFKFSETPIEQAIATIPIEYPCIVKPLQSIDGSKRDISVCEDANILVAVLKMLNNQYNEVLIQEFIEKEGELGIQGFSTYGGKNVIVPGIIVKIRQSRVAPGSTTYAKLAKKHSLVELPKIESLIKDLGYTGIFDIELIYKGNRVYFIEMNFRNGAYGYAFTKAGVNIPALWCLNIIGHDIFGVPLVIDNELTLMDEIADFRNVIDKRIGLLKWIMQFLSTDVHLLFNKRDLKPFIYRFIELYSR